MSLKHTLAAALWLPLLAWAQTPVGPITVHHIGPLTGVLAASNKESLDGARLHLDAFNARGGVAGRPVRLELLDDTQDAKKAAELLDGLVTKGPAGQPLLLMMPRTTPSMEAMLPAVGKHGIPVLGPQTGGSFVNQPPRREVFTLRASYQKEAEAAIRQQHSIGVRSFALLLADDAFGRDTLIAVDRVMKELGITPLAAPRIDNRKPDVAAAVREVLDKRPQVVLMIASSKAASDFVKAYRGAGASATFVTLSNTSNNDYVKGLGEHSRGAIVMQVMPSPFSAGTPLARDYAAAAAKAQQPMSYAGFYGYASARLLTLALGRAGREPTRESLLAALEGLGDFDLGGLRLRYGPGERVGSNYVEPTIITHEGRFMR